MKLLLVTPVVPFPPNTGGRQRTNMLFRALSRLGHTDTFVLSGEQDISSGARDRLAREFNVIGSARPQQVSETGWFRLLRPLHPGHVNRVANVLAPMRQFTEPHPRVAAALRAATDLGDYDFIVGRYLSSVVAADLLGHRRVVVDVDDLPTTLLDMRLASKADTGIRKAYLRRLRTRLTAVERRLLTACSHVWVANPTDLSHVDHDRASVLPNIPFAAEGVPEICDRHVTQAISSRILLTVGMLNHVPNIQGIDRFLAAAWPAIRARVPGAQYRIVGSLLGPDLAERWSRNPGVTVVGFVDDLRGEYEAAAATVCPIPWGGGTNIKVAESFAYGVPSIISAAAHRGWHEVFPDGDAVLVARSDEAFVEHAVELLDKPQRRHAMGDSGREAVRKHLRFETICRRVQADIEALLAGATQ